MLNRRRSRPSRRTSPAFGGARSLIGASAAALVVVAATLGAAQPRATAILRPVEAGGWTLDVSRGPTSTIGEVCLGHGLYVLAVRVEPGHAGAAYVSRGRSADVDPRRLLQLLGEAIASGESAEITAETSTWISIDASAGDRWEWDAFEVPGNRDCFIVGAAAYRGQPTADRGQAGFRAQIYHVRIGVDW